MARHQPPPSPSRVVCDQAIGGYHARVSTSSPDRLAKNSTHTVLRDDGSSLTPPSEPPAWTKEEQFLVAPAFNDEHTPDRREAMDIDDADYDDELRTREPRRQPHYAFNDDRPLCKDPYRAPSDELRTREPRRHPHYAFIDEHPQDVPQNAFNDELPTRDNRRYPHIANDDAHPHSGPHDAIIDDHPHGGLHDAIID